MTEVSKIDWNMVAKKARKVASTELNADVRFIAIWPDKKLEQIPDSDHDPNRCYVVVGKSAIVFEKKGAPCEPASTTP